uniref:G2/M phase-specific E3 ubiquitin-protein ligase-like n=1 Tax=Semicossyphus pulcher TaxID=241346 RepID=UPI0037E8F1A3
MSKLQYGFDIKFTPGGTLLFEGEKDHLIPSTSHFLLESDFFVVAGRMIGHSFLHGGPSLGGLSPAILHVLFGGSPEEATIDIKDCADLDIRETIKMLDGTAELSADVKDTINELAMSWDLPLVTSENRRWLLDKLLIHAVLRRTSRQVKQLRRGLKETLIWPLLTERKDTIPLLFPGTSDMQCTPQMVLEKINWPSQDQEEESDVSLEDACRITGYLRTFIENASPNLLGKLVRFWVGWDVLPRQLDVEVVESSFPGSSTCFHLLKLPAHCKDYNIFERDILAAIWSVDTGFGLV